MPFKINEMINYVLEDYRAWWKRGAETGNWVQDGIPFMQSIAGCAKTAIVLEVAKRLRDGYKDLPKLPQANPPVQLFFNAAMDPESIAGTPAPGKMKIRQINPAFDPAKPEGEGNERTLLREKPALIFLHREELLRPMQYDPGAILFCDEVGREAPHLRATMLKLFSWEKTLAGLDMSHFYIICAGNPSDEQHRVDDIMADAAMASRLIRLGISPDPTEWADYMYGISKTHQEVANFILDFPQMFIGRDNPNDPSSPFHNPRAWTICATALHVHGGGTKESAAAIRNLAATETVRGIVGDNATAQLAAYLNAERPMCLSAILKGRFQTDENGRMRQTAPASTIRALQEFLQKTAMNDVEADNVARFVKGLPADVGHSISRENRIILPENLAALASKGTFANILKRVKKLDQTV